MKMKKEEVKSEFIKMIQNSWTYARLTETERQKFWDCIRWQDIQGTALQRWKALNCIYSAYLTALGYKPIGWRESEKDAPQF